MPNYVTHRIVITGSVNTVNAIRSKSIQDGCFSFDAYYPEPAEVDWYERRIANWGTKWDAIDYEEIRFESGYWEFSFQTAWVSPWPIFGIMVDLFPEIEIVMMIYEEGWFFDRSGLVTYGSGIWEKRMVDSKIADPQAAFMGIYRTVFDYEYERGDDE